jgi:oligogalacturonide transport system permease protein
MKNTKPPNTVNRLKLMSLKRKDRLIGLLFFSPWIMGFLLFTLYPLIYSIRLSFNEYQQLPGGAVMNWAGLRYFEQAWNVDLNFKVNLSNTMLFIGCGTPVILVFALILAILLNNNFPLRSFFRVLFFMPVLIMSGPVINRLLSRYTTDFSANSPMIYQFINNLPEFISKPVLMVLNNLVLMLWFSGVQILIFLAGLQKISPDLYAAAEIDGAGTWEKFWKITLPFMKPLILVTTAYTVMTLSNYSNNSVNRQIRDSMFLTSNLYSLAAAMSWIYFISLVLLLLLIYLILFLFDRRHQRG